MGEWVELMYPSPRLDRAFRTLRRADPQKASAGMCFSWDMLPPEVWHAGGFPHENAQPGSPACKAQNGHTGWPQLPIPPSCFAACPQSTSSSQNHGTLVTLASPPREASNHQGHGQVKPHASGPDSGLSASVLALLWRQGGAVHTCI